MAKSSLASMSVDAPLKLRDDIGNVLSRKADQLHDQLSRLGGAVGSKKRRGGSSLKGRKAAVKYRDRSGNTWAERGATPIWLREKLKAGAKLEEFAVHKTVVRLAGYEDHRCRRRRQILQITDYTTAMLESNFSEATAGKLG